jgi:polyvinyl alcohol dehydrogenase (cytochrome)
VSGHDIGNTRDMPDEHAIGPANVLRLTPAWSIAIAGVRGTPAVAGGSVYFADLSGKLRAVAAATGRVVWSADISAYTGIAGSFSRDSPAVYGDELVLGDTSTPGHGAYEFAVNRYTGRLLWRTETDGDVAAIMTSSPVVYRGVVYVGVSSDEELLTTLPGFKCCTFRGSVVAMNAATGRILWKTYTVPGGYSGGAVWGSTPAVDPASDLLYAGTGNNYTVPAGVCTSPDEKNCAQPAAADHSDAVLALNLATGAIRWSKPTLTSDVYTDVCDRKPNTGCGPDFDFGSGPNLIRLPSGRQLVGIGQKSGVYWALDPCTGAVVWWTLAGPGGDLGGIQWDPPPMAGACTWRSATPARSLTGSPPRPGRRL